MKSTYRHFSLFKNMKFEPQIVVEVVCYLENIKLKKVPLLKENWAHPDKNQSFSHNFIEIINSIQ